MKPGLKGINVVLLLTMIACGLVLHGCDSNDPSDSDDVPEDNTVTSIVVRANQQRVIGVDAAVQLTAEARNAQGGVVEGVAFTWSSDNERVAVVNAAGRVTTTGIGRAKIEAETAGIVGSIEIDALPAGPQQLMLSAPNQVLPDDGFVLQLTLTALDALGEPIPDPDVSWLSSAPDVVSVDEMGQVTTGEPGESFIFVESDNAEAQLKFDVVRTTGAGIPQIDLSFLTTFKGIESTEEIIAPQGMSVALVREGRLVLARGYGTARDDNPITGPLVEEAMPTSLYRIADVSKSITAVAVLKLVEQQRLSLEDTLLTVVPDLIPASGLGDERANEIRMWNLLEHKGGWDRSISPNPLYNLRTIAEELGGPLPPLSQTVGQWLFQQPLDFDPGTQFSFNDANYFLLGEVVEAVTGQSYESFVQQEILTPIGISSMQIGQTVDRVDGEVTYFHGALGPSVLDQFPGDRPVQYGGSFDVPLLGSSGGWIGSVVDLARFGLAVHRRSILSDNLLHDYMISDNSGNGVYGAGWILDGRNYLHTGLIDGSSSFLYVFQDGTVLAILLNGNSTVNFRRWLDPVIENTDWPKIGRLLICLTNFKKPETNESITPHPVLKPHRIQLY